VENQNLGEIRSDCGCGGGIGGWGTANPQIGWRRGGSRVGVSRISPLKGGGGGGGGAAGEACKREEAEDGSSGCEVYIAKPIPWLSSGWALLGTF
jgi:hypothetical protein